MITQLVFDIETDGLLHDCQNMWILRGQDVKTGERFRFLQHDMGWRELLNSYGVVIGHNIINYDLNVLKKLFGFELNENVRVIDTLILSQILNYNRFDGQGHSLERWGTKLGCPKIDFHDWSGYSEEMDIYCERDVDLNVRVLLELNREFGESPPRVKEKLSKYIKHEHIAARFVASANLNGWRIDKDKANALYEKLEEEKKLIVEALEKDLGFKAVAVDKVKGEVPCHSPKYTKFGKYVKYQADWFGIEPEHAWDDEYAILGGDYSRVEIVPLKLTSVTDVKIYLNRLGWVPTQWNIKVDAEGNRHKTTPKITEDSLEFLGEKGKMYRDFLTISSRAAIVNTWLKEEKNGRVHGDCFTIGTPSMRARHSIIVNVPAVKSKYGAEMRDLFIADEGKKIVGADSAGNQARGLAHFIDNEDFTRILLEEDIHQFNANALTRVLQEKLGLDHVVSRDRAKRVLYAFLFGASGAKIWSYIFDVFEVEKGNKLREGFTAEVPGFKVLVDTLLEEFKASKNAKDRDKRSSTGYILSLAGNRIYTDGRHKLLVYLLQSAEKITCCSAIAWLDSKLKEENIPYQPLIFYHDEIQIMVDEKDAERVAELAALAFKEGPKEFGVMIMDGEAKIGNSWFETH